MLNVSQIDIKYDKKNAPSFSYCQFSVIACFSIVQVLHCAQLVFRPCQDQLQKIKIFASFTLTTTTTTTRAFISLYSMYMKVTGPHCLRHRNLAQGNCCRLSAKRFVQTTTTGNSFHWQRICLQFSPKLEADFSDFFSCLPLSPLRCVHYSHHKTPSSSQLSLYTNIENKLLPFAAAQLWLVLHYFYYYFKQKSALGCKSFLFLQLLKRDVTEHPV